MGINRCCYVYIKYLPTGPSYSVGMLENDRKYNVLGTYSVYII
jgi:hypothetical protein